MEEREWSTQFYLNGYSIDILGCSPPDKYVIRLFQKSSINKISKLLIETMQLGHVEDSTNYQEVTDRIGLVSIANQFKERLEILGYSLNDAERDFQVAKETVLQRLKKSENKDWTNPSFPDQEAFETINSKLEYMLRVDFSIFSYRQMTS